MAKSLMSTLDADKRSEVEDLVRETIGDQKITQSRYESCARAMKRDRYPNDRYEVRRQDLILFVEETLSGEGARTLLSPALRRTCWILPSVSGRRSTLRSS